jgi:hypothetical protein
MEAARWGAASNERFVLSAASVFAEFRGHLTDSGRGLSVRPEPCSPIDSKGTGK